MGLRKQVADDINARQDFMWHLVVAILNIQDRRFSNGHAPMEELHLTKDQWRELGQDFCFRTGSLKLPGNPQVAGVTLVEDRNQ